MLLCRLRVDQNIINEYLDELVQVLRNTPFIKLMNTPRAFVSPNGKIVNSYYPNLILKGGLRDVILLDP